MTKIIYPAVFVVVIAVCVFVVFTRRNRGFAQTKKRAPVRITAEQGKTMMDSGNPFILLDVRSKEEYDTGHIHGAILLPDDEIRERAAEVLHDTESTIIVYCRSGRRSAGAAQNLFNMGYKNIYDMGGIINWPYGIEK